MGNYRQLEYYDRLLDRALQLTLADLRSPAAAKILHAEGFRTPRRQRRISADMVKNMLEKESCHQQLHNPTLHEHEWRAEVLATELGVPVKRLKDWVNRGWVTAVQRPFARTWVIYADEQESD